jgi:hypothetical protein
LRLCGFCGFVPLQLCDFAVFAALREPPADLGSFHQCRSRQDAKTREARKYSQRSSQIQQKKLEILQKKLANTAEEARKYCRRSSQILQKMNVA